MPLPARHSYDAKGHSSGQQFTCTAAQLGHTAASAMPFALPMSPKLATREGPIELVVPSHR